ncbi:MAG: hypothetical protein JNM17_35960 [Archangium sp.]|nr:hypothetical protein [Archangium sp.]
MATQGAQTYTFFFMTDVTRATDRTQDQTWASSSTSTSAPVTAWGWVKR